MSEKSIIFAPKKDITMASKNIRYINPLTDFGFKKVFGNEDIMCDFLNDIIEPKAPIVSLTFLDKEMKPQTKFEHGVVYDMRCKLSTGEEIIVEMQNRSQDYFKDRICFYMSHAIAAQGERGEEEWRFQLHPVYGVFFMNFNLKDSTKTDADFRNLHLNQLHDVRHVALADVDTHDLFSDKLQIWLIELPRYRTMTEADCKTNRDYWLYILTHLETMNTAVPFQAEKPIFRKVESIADMALLTHDEREYYNISLNSFRTNLAVMEHEHNAGREERTLEIARSMKADGMPIDRISHYTGLTNEEIERL